MFILENLKLHLTRSECELTFTFSSTLWVSLAFVIIIHETSEKPREHPGKLGFWWQVYMMRHHER